MLTRPPAPGWDDILRRQRPTLWIAVVALVLAFALLGSRGIWDPDEGRYTNVAINMLASGDWIQPKRNDDVGHWTKPPLTYWAIAASIATFGLNPWAARLPSALAYLACIWLAWRIGRRLTPGVEDAAALVYATMLLPFGASQLITTDFLLAAFETLALWAYVEARWGEAPSWRWNLLLWIALALAFLTKGPPGLLPLLVMLVCDWLLPGPRRTLQLTGIAAFAALAVPWYVIVVHNTPGLLDYFLLDEVVNRVATDQFGRNGQWYGWLVVYLPTLLLGSMPWSFSLWRASRALPARIVHWRDPAVRARDIHLVFLAAWVLLPLVVFCISRSRLPLYILPLFVPLALLIAMQRQRDGRSLPRPTWLIGWCVGLLAIKLAAAAFPSHKNAAEWAEALQARAPWTIHEVVFIDDMARYGLRLHLNAEIEKVSLEPVPGARFNPVYDEDLQTELAEQEPGLVFVTKQTHWAQVRGHIVALGYDVEVLGTPYRERVIFAVTPTH